MAAVTYPLADHLIKLFQATSTLLAPVYEPLHQAVHAHLWLAYVPAARRQAIESFVSRHALPHAQHLPLTHPTSVFLCILGYFLFVGFGCWWLGDKARGDAWAPKQATMKRFMLVHNAWMVFLSAWMVVEVLAQAWVQGYTFWPNPVDASPAGFGMAKALWVFYISKPMEFIDTAIMIAKRNFRQVSFLHVYHHASIFSVYWLEMTFGCNGNAYLPAVMNAGVHVIMYGYYFAMGMGWKRVAAIKYYITYIQMTQFAINLLLSGAAVFIGYDGYPIFLSRVLFVYMITMLVLFGNFLVKDKKRTLLARKKRN